MKPMNPTEILAHEKYAMMRFFDGGSSYYLCGTFDELDAAKKSCAEMNAAMRPMYGEDQYEVVEVRH